MTNTSSYISATKAEILAQLQSGELLIVNPQRKNGLIICYSFHAEFAGPGAIVGGNFDQDVIKIIPVGHLSLTKPQNREERNKAYLIRRQWIKLTLHITDNPVALERGQVILNQFQHWFDRETTTQVPDWAFAMLVGVMPETIKQARDS